MVQFAIELLHARKQSSAEMLISMSHLLLKAVI